MMNKVSQMEISSVGNTHTIRSNFLSIQQNDNRMWSTIAIVDQLEKVEKWGYKIAFNLVLPGDKVKNRPKRSMTVFAVSLFLYLFALKTMLCQLLIPDNSPGLLLMSGDLSQFFGRAFNRLYFNSLLISYGFHAAFVYTLLSRSSNKARDWVLRFDENWRHTYFRAPNPQKEIIDNLMKNVRTGLKVFKVSTIIEMALMTGLIFYGGINFRSLDTSAILYAVWGFITIVWCLLQTIVNLTALTQYYIMTRAIIIRFGEARLDFEYAIRSKPPAEPYVISKLFEKHYIVCDMVIGSNQHFKSYLFFFFTIMVFHECFLFYHLFTIKIPLIMKIVVWVYIFLDAVQILLVSLCSAKITSIAHKPYHVVHGVGRMTLPEDVQVQAQLFVERLSGGSIGMTILDGFVVTGGVLSSILTGIVTYFSIIVEMN